MWWWWMRWWWCRKRWYENNKERLASSQRSYCQQNKEHIRNYRRQYCKNNRERINEYWRSYYAKNKERIRQRLHDQKQRKLGQNIVRFGARHQESVKLETSLVTNTLWNTDGQDLELKIVINSLSEFMLLFLSSLFNKRYKDSDSFLFCFFVVVVFYEFLSYNKSYTLHPSCVFRVNGV